jgi:hypothetical protein
MMAKSKEYSQKVAKKSEQREDEPFFRSTIAKYPSSSTAAISPVLNHPSGVIAFLVASGLFKYPLLKIWLNHRETADRKKDKLHNDRTPNPQFTSLTLANVVPIIVY